MAAFCHIYAQWDQVRERLPEVYKHLSSLGLICDITFDEVQSKRFPSELAAIQEAGGLCAPNLYPATLDPESQDANWWKYSHDECVRLLKIAVAKHKAYGIGPLTAINTYTPGTAFVSACKEVGIEYILGFCAPTVIEDGEWEITHYGSPLSPFFPSSEDFRKPSKSETGNGNPVLLSSMELRNPLICLNHWSEGPWCPLNALAADRWLEPSQQPLPFLQIAEDWLRQSEISGRTLFFHINLQYFFNDRCYEHNARALEWLASQKELGRLEIGGLRQWRERLEASSGFVRQTTYWRGEMIGFHVGHRPGCFDDVIVDESLQRQAVWQKPDPIPRRLYSYNQAWEYPAFQPDGSAPESKDLSNIKVYTEYAKLNKTDSHIQVLIKNDGEAQDTPLILWDVQADAYNSTEIHCLSKGWAIQKVPHPSGSTGAILIEGNIPHGASVVELKLIGRGLDCAVIPKTERRWGNLLVAQCFEIGDQIYTILAAQTPEPFAVNVATTYDGSIKLESLCGIDYSLRQLGHEPVQLDFDGTRLACWHRFWGVYPEQLTISGVQDAEKVLRERTHHAAKQIAGDVEIPAPGYQLFGNIRDAGRWDRGMARRLGEKEKHAMNQWMLKQRPGTGRIVVEVHPGIYLPRGSITKALGHEFDSIVCSDNLEFRELCVDYPQAWDWGIAAWVQWRHLRMSLKGLQGRSGKHFLHLHAFDPEKRGINQRVHLYELDANGHTIHRPSPLGCTNTADICVKPDWELPRGIEHRWDERSLCSIEIPKYCYDWNAIGIWVTPLAPIKVDNWIASKAFPGLISHLWLTAL